MSPLAAGLLTTWAAGAGLVGRYFFNLLPEASPGAAAALASDDPETRKQAIYLVAFICVLFGALWPLVVLFLAITRSTKKL